MVEAGRIYQDGKLKSWNRDRENVREADAVVLEMGFMMLKSGPKAEADSSSSFSVSSPWQ
jgi:hypothetical protein